MEWSPTATGFFNAILHPLVIILVFQVLVAITLIILVCLPKEKFKQLQDILSTSLKRAIMVHEVCSLSEAESRMTRYCASKKKYLFGLMESLELMLDKTEHPLNSRIRCWIDKQAYHAIRRGLIQEIFLAALFCVEIQH